MTDKNDIGRDETKVQDSAKQHAEAEAKLAEDKADVVKKEADEKREEAKKV
jgi:hypothetical protein